MEGRKTSVQAPIPGPHCSSPHTLAAMEGDKRRVPRDSADVSCKRLSAKYSDGQERGLRRLLIPEYHKGRKKEGGEQPSSQVQRKDSSSRSKTVQGHPSFPSVCWVLFVCFETGSPQVALAALELEKILLPHPPECWDCRYAPPCLGTFQFSSCKKKASVDPGYQRLLRQGCRQSEQRQKPYLLGCEEPVGIE